MINTSATGRATSSRLCIRSSEGKEHVLGVTELFESGYARKLNHGWRAAHQDERVWSRWRHVILDHLPGDETGTVLPGVRGSVDRVPQMKILLLRISLLDRFSAEDITGQDGVDAIG